MVAGVVVGTVVGGVVAGVVVGTVVVVAAATVDVVAAEPAVVALVVAVEALTFFDFGPAATLATITNTNIAKIALTTLCLRNQPMTYSSIPHDTVSLTYCRLKT